MEIVDDQVILVARKQDLEKMERTNIPDDMEIEAKPVVAIIGAGAGNTNDDDDDVCLYIDIFSAGFTCADMLRQNGFRGRVIMFTSEGSLPYDRVRILILVFSEKCFLYLSSFPSGSFIKKSIKKTSRSSSS